MAQGCLRMHPGLSHASNSGLSNTILPCRIDRRPSSQGLSILHVLQLYIDCKTLLLCIILIEGERLNPAVLADPQKLHIANMDPDKTLQWVMSISDWR